MEEPVDARNGWFAFAIGSAAFAAVTAIFGKLGVAEINSNFATLIRTVVIVIATACVVSVRGDWEPFSRLSRHGVMWLLLSGITTTASWLCYYRALQLGPVTRVAPIDKLSVAFACILGVVLLGEPMSWRMVVGCLLVITGALVLSGS